MSLFEPIFAALSGVHARYVIVGGLATVLQGFARLTADVDLFVESPIPFDELWARADVFGLATTRVRVAAIPDLIRMKRLAGRPQDAIDIEALERIARRRAERDAAE